LNEVVLQLPLGFKELREACTPIPEFVEFQKNLDEGTKQSHKKAHCFNTALIDLMRDLPLLRIFILQLLTCMQWL
jgi:hypothetical protein